MDIIEQVSNSAGYDKKDLQIINLIYPIMHLKIRRGIYIILAYFSMKMYFVYS